MNDYKSRNLYCGSVTPESFKYNSKGKITQVTVDDDYEEPSEVPVVE